MLGFMSFRLSVLVQCAIIRTVLSAPYLVTRNITSSHLNIVGQVSAPITLHPLNSTYLVEETEIRYNVPNTETTLYFHLGFPCKEVSIRSTVISGRDYCEQHIKQGHDGPLPRSEDPFHEDRGYGAAINVVSTRPDHRLTWNILKDAMDALWEVLIVDGHYVESEFHIYHGRWNLVGRGTIIETPETQLAPQSRKREVRDSWGATFD